MIKNLIAYLAIVILALPLLGVETLCGGIKNYSYKNGESITYKVYYKYKRFNATAGEVTFSTTYEKFNNKPVFHVKGDGKTYKNYDWFFKVRDLYESYIDTNTLMPVKFVRNVNEGNYKTYNNVRFNHNLKSATSTKKTINIESCTQDVLSTIYYVRNFDFNKLKPGDKIPFSMYIDDEVFYLNLKYLGKEKLQIGRALFNTVKFSPDLVKGTMFDGDQTMTVWATDDANHIPLRIEATISVGAIRADVLDFKNLRNDLSSYIKKL
jgi:hypothetical protein